MLFSKKNSTENTGSIEYIIVGLGNPGSQYENTRHNAGFITLDTIAKKNDIKVDRLKFKSLCGAGTIGGKRVLLMKPSTFMNNSGEAVSEAMRFYKLRPDQLIVLSDDISLAPGRVRIRKKGSAGGHNGIKSIIAMTGTQGFSRIKVGVGEKPQGWDLADHVLGRFSSEDRAKVEEAIGHAMDAAVLMMQGETDKAMNIYN